MRDFIWDTEKVDHTLLSKGWENWIQNKLKTFYSAFNLRWILFIVSAFPDLHCKQDERRNKGSKVKY